jgi:hypothetical protein
VFQVPDVDNIPDLHGNPAGADLVLLIGGNQFFVLPQLIAGFEAPHPELKVSESVWDARSSMTRLAWHLPVRVEKSLAGTAISRAARKPH